MADIRAMFFVVRRGHRYDEDVGGRNVGRCGERPARDDALDESVEIDLFDVNPAAVDRFDDLRAHVDAGNLTARARDQRRGRQADIAQAEDGDLLRSEEHTSELQSLMRISYAVFCLKKK